ncbi:MAG: TetR/AcrR family transcriptional regulator C-terminal domain-containing protein [Clostridia bacterium]|nr:TetR/AcrR family transcriptional regulator C-terminal domain-containing protein [Clostridia bacterium]MBQ8772243.1 TetR/AcrR family transcriptional regulator C-terminal domain-containing protein [Clostridia bacterium]
MPHILYNKSEVNNMSASEITKKALVDAFKDVLQTTPFDKITVGDISARATVNRQTFYYHFADKFDLTDTIICNELVFPLAHTLDKGEFYQAFEQMFTYLQDNRSFYLKILKSKAADSITTYTKQIFGNIIVLVSNGQIKKTDIAADFYANGLSGTVVDWCLNPRGLTATDMAKLAWQYTTQFSKTSP